MATFKSRAIRITQHGGPEQLQLVETEVGEPGPGEVRIRHHAIGLNFIDTYQRSGLYPMSLPLTLGSEGAGVIEAVGEGVTHLQVGDRAAYAGSGQPGSYCDLRVMPAMSVCRLPDAISFETGAAMMLKGLIYCQGDIDLTGTALVSVGETFVFKDTDNGYDTYNLDVSGTVTFTNTAIISAGSSSYNFDASGATGFTQSGGSHTKYNTFVTAAGQTMSGIVFQSGGTATIANTLSDSTFNQCGLITVTGVLDNCTVNESTATSAVTTTTLAKLTECTFISDGTGHAVNLGTISSTQAMTWSCSDSGYAATNGTSGNETILVNVASGQTLTINVATGATTPTYYNTGTGTVTVISGAVTVRVTAATVNGTKVQDARVYLKKVSDGTVILNGLSNANGIVEDTAYTYTTDENVTGWIRKSTSTPLYKQAPLSGTITSTGFSTTGVLILDE